MLKFTWPNLFVADFTHGDPVFYRKEKGWKGGGGEVGR